MSVAELIEKLREVDPSLHVDTWAADGAMGGNYWDDAREEQQ